MEQPITYFAYGSNLDLKHLAFLKVKITAVEKAKLPGYKLVFNVLDESKNGAGYANIVGEWGAVTEGLIIYTDDRSVDYLDEYEGFPVLYQKRLLSVLTLEDEKRTALVYIGNEEMTRPDLFPTKDHLNNILCGKSFFSQAYVEKLSQLKTI